MADEDVYVEETYVFTYDQVATKIEGSPKKNQTLSANSVS